MNTLMNLKSFAMSLISVEGHQQTIKSDNCVIKSITIDSPQPEQIMYMNGKHDLLKPIQEYNMKLEISFIDWEMLMGNVDDKKVSNKKVKDCSIRELLFAIRQKQKRN